MSGVDAIVGVSVSDPGEDELARHGLIGAHTAHAFVELARQVLAAGGSLAYGGHLGGFTATLFSLLATYSPEDRPDPERVRQYLARPIWQKLTQAERAELATYATWTEVPAVGRGNDAATHAREFIAMRELMTEEITARVILGGAVSGYKGRWPGIVEEAFLAVEAGLPVYVAGGLGGAAERVALAVRGTWPADLAARAELPGRSEEEVRALLVGADLRNGLDKAENAQLMTTSDLDLIAALILRGLRA
jgi:hypothetical protein